MGLRSTYLHNFQLQQKQYCGDWMLSLRYEDHLYAKLFHHLVSLHCYDQVICYVWWKPGFEIRIILITIRGFGISKKFNPEECGNGDGRREGFFFLIWRQEWRNEAKERESQSNPQTSIKKAFKFLLSHSDYSKPGPQFLLSTSYMPKRTAYNELCWTSLITKINEILKIHIDISY